MSAAALLRTLRARGICLSADSPDRLEVDAPSGVLTNADRDAIRLYKPELLQLLRPSIPPWDQAKAERLLADLLQTAEDIRRQDFGGTWPTALGNVVADLMAIAAGYLDHRAEEAAHGWDALELLRGVKPTLLQIVSNWKKRHLQTEHR